MTDKGFKCPPPLPPPKKEEEITKQTNNQKKKKKPKNLLVHVLNCALCFQIRRLLEK